MGGILKSIWPWLLIVLVVAGAGWWVFWTYLDTYHLATIHEGAVYRDGVRSLHQFDLAARKTHIKTVVCLVDDQEIAVEPFKGEMEYCKSHGIEVVRLPVALGGWPSGAQIRRFLAIATDPQYQPVLVHCAQGVRRTGMMAVAYERSVQKMSKEQSTAAMLTFGHSNRMVGDVKRFIDVYDPDAREMKIALPASRE